MDASGSSKDLFRNRPNYVKGESHPKRLSSRKLAMAKTTFSENAHQFAQNTTLHAFKFVGDRNITYFERIFFMIAFIISLTLALNFIMNIYNKWTSTPVIIANSASSTYISQIPFPAVTICNMNQALKSKVTSLNRNSSRFSILQTFCNRQDEIESTNFSNKWSDYEDFITESTQNCQKMLMVCRYASRPMNCTDYFKSVLTDEGRCCTFNTVENNFMYLNPSNSYQYDSLPKDYVGLDWTPEVGYPEILPSKFSPIPGFGTGYSMGLTLILNAETDEYYCSSTNGPGFKVRLHSPTETPNVGDEGFSVQVGYETRIVISPVLADASYTIRDMRKETRQCLFANEANLTYFRTYSRRNCEMECEARLVAEECKCIMYYMPRIRLDIPICGLKDQACFQGVNLKVQTANQDNNNCSQECIIACFDLTYEASTFASPILQGKFRMRERLIQNMTAGFAEKNLAILHFYYIENAFRSRTKEQFVGFTEFLSSTGGLMGLFVGFSVISLVEICYYSSFRPYCANRRYKAQASHLKPVRHESWPSKSLKPLKSAEEEFTLEYSHPNSKIFKKMQGFDTSYEKNYANKYLP